jgi:4-alpha-glucanotransferase
MAIPALEKRGSGILLHLTSLPSDFGIGDMGPWAYRFADFLAESGQRLWQVLPLNPTDPVHGNSPYDSISAFGCSPLLISPERLVDQGLLARQELGSAPDFPRDRIDYRGVISFKQGLFSLAQSRFRAGGTAEDYGRFCSENADWLEDLALFAALKERFDGRPWQEWPADLRDRDPASLEAARRALAGRIEEGKILQYLFERQWVALREYCNRRNVVIFGDLPVYVNLDSVDVWTHPELFKLDPDKRPTAVAGVPPDYFSETGQRWGNPVYRWDALRESGYAWWIRRLARNLHLFDMVRIDHFRGFAAYWEIPAEEPTAVRGKWVPGPGNDFFQALLRHFPYLPIVAEDLGTITQDVRDLMDRFDLPGMKVLLFAFGDNLATNPYVPHNHVRNCLIYTGTHDNNTVKGWFEREVTGEDRERLFRYLGREVGPERICEEMVRMAMMSVANTAILPMQDLLGLGEEARMNRPARKDGNWQWRLLPEQLSPELAAGLRRMTETYGRIA